MQPPEKPAGRGALLLARSHPAATFQRRLMMPRFRLARSRERARRPPQFGRLRRYARLCVTRRCSLSRARASGRELVARTNREAGCVPDVFSDSVYTQSSGRETSKRERERKRESLTGTTLRANTRVDQIRPYCTRNTHTIIRRIHAYTEIEGERERERLRRLSL